MSNKNSLILNNSNLLEISNTIQNLPESVYWTGEEYIIPGSEAVTIPAYTDTELTVNPVQTEEKTVTPSGSQQIITPATGKYLSKVTVGAIPGSYANLSAMGFSRYATGVYTPTSSTDEITIVHNMGIAPKIVTIYALDGSLSLISSLELYTNSGNAFGYVQGMRDQACTGISPNITSFNIGGTWYEETTDSLQTLAFSRNRYAEPFKSGIQYRWITFA